MNHSHSQPRWVLAIMVVMLSAPLMAQPAQVPTQENYPPIGKLVDIGGYRLHIHATGSGKPTVVLMAGAGDFSFDWSLVQPKVSTFAQVVSYDRAGLAWSDLGPTPRTMRQEAYELHLLLRKAGLKAPYVLVGHSVGGLIARVYARDYPAEVAGMVLVDATDEDTTLMYQGKLVKVRSTAEDRPVPAVQTIKSSPPKPPTEDDKKQAEFNLQTFGPPKIEAPFDKLSPDVQKVRLWAMAHPKLSAATDDYWPEELQAIYVDRKTDPTPLGDKPLVVLIAGQVEDRPQDVSAEDWNQLVKQKRQAKLDMANLSRNHAVVIAEHSEHHIQLDEPDLVVTAIRQVAASTLNRSDISNVR
jgi:pimeloyl-ACP methyl ester carboxylesterase